MNYAKRILTFALLLTLGACAGSAARGHAVSMLPNVSAPDPRVHPTYTFSCDPRKYVHTTVLNVQPGTTHATVGVYPASDVTYYPIAGFCGVDNSFLTNGEVTIRNMFERRGTIMNPNVTFSTNFDWKNKPEVAIWEEAWIGNIFRDTKDDIHVVLLHVL